MVILVPKNDSFFTEQLKHDRLKLISNFSGSAGIAIISKKKLSFVDSRYTIQAKLEAGKNFKIIKIHEKLPKDKFKNIELGFDPTLFTYSQLKHLFGDNIKLKAIKENLIDKIFRLNLKKDKPFFQYQIVLQDKVIKKIKLVSKFFKK